MDKDGNIVHEFNNKGEETASSAKMKLKPNNPTTTPKNDEEQQQKKAPPPDAESIPHEGETVPSQKMMVDDDCDEEKKKCVECAKEKGRKAFNTTQWSAPYCRICLDCLNKRKERARLAAYGLGGMSPY